ncbi:peptidoglycan editing factor PgeF [Clostridiaceae bacterium M8S5]|nr:peptidoglycan editing factor PgeF [Clostridiaceae bacterium M8S5]
MSNNDFVLKEKEGIKYYEDRNLAENGFKHMFTTRVGGMSKEKFSSLNMGISTNDNIDDVLKNYESVLKVIDVDKDKVYMTKQVHEDNIIAIDKNNYSSLDYTLLRENGVDGLVTNVKDIALFCYSADCVTLVFLDSKKQVAGVAHAGWKGTVKGIASKMIEMFIKKYGCNVEDILVTIGPAIGPCCFEVKEDVYKVFSEKFKSKYIGDITNQISKEKWTIDLFKANEIIIKEKGIKDRNITVSKLCTFCNEDLFFSYRRDKGITGRMATIVKL